MIYVVRGCTCECKSLWSPEEDRTSVGLDSLELTLQTIGSHLTWELVTRLDSSTRVVLALDGEPSLQALVLVLVCFCFETGSRVVQAGLELRI